MQAWQDWKSPKGCLAAALGGLRFSFPVASWPVASSLPYDCFRSNRSRFITFVQAAMKAWTNFSLASAAA
jgi:hypothetical protein